MSVTAPKNPSQKDMFAWTATPTTWAQDYITAQRLYGEENDFVNAIKLCFNNVYSSEGIEGVERYLAGEKPSLKILRQILNNLMRVIRKETTRGIDVPRIIKNVPYSTEEIPEFLVIKKIRVFKLAIEDICFKEWERSHPAPVSPVSPVPPAPDPVPPVPPVSPAPDPVAPVPPVSPAPDPVAPVPPVSPAPDPVAPGEEFGNYWDVEIPEYIKSEILNILNSPRDSQETDFYTAFSNRLKRIVPLLKEAKIRTSKIEEIYQFIDKQISQNNIQKLKEQFFLKFIGVFFRRPPLDLVNTFINLKAQFN